MRKKIVIKTVLVFSVAVAITSGIVAFFFPSPKTLRELTNVDRVMVSSAVYVKTEMPMALKDTDALFDGTLTRVRVHGTLTDVEEINFYGNNKEVLLTISNCNKDDLYIINGDVYKLNYIPKD